MMRYENIFAALGGELDKATQCTRDSLNQQ